MYVKSDITEIIHAKGFKIANRPENFSMMDMLEFTDRDVREVLLSLTKDDYIKGPMPDDKGRSSSVWAFGRNIAGHDVYIKLTIRIKGKRKNVVCISFHESTKPFPPR